MPRQVQSLWGCGALVPCSGWCQVSTYHSVQVSSAIGHRDCLRVQTSATSHFRARTANNLSASYEKRWNLRDGGFADVLRYFNCTSVRPESFNGRRGRVAAQQDCLSGALRKQAGPEPRRSSLQGHEQCEHKESRDPPPHCNTGAQSIAVMCVRAASVIEQLTSTSNTT